MNWPKIGLIVLAILLIIVGALWIAYPNWFKIDKTEVKDKVKLYGLYTGSGVMILIGAIAGYYGIKA
jgi:hypothetical protein